MSTASQNKRRSLRLKGFDYTRPGAYSITICTVMNRHIFGHVVDGVMAFSATGAIVEACWQAIPEHSPTVKPVVFQIMPNHVHGILWITAVGPSNKRNARRNGPAAGSLGAVVGSFKSAASRLNNENLAPGARRTLWERDFHDRIIRNEQELAALRAYIRNNPASWSEKYGR